jgi:hypothetical protein
MCHSDLVIYRPHYKVAPCCEKCKFCTAHAKDFDEPVNPHIVGDIWKWKCEYGDMMTFVVQRDCVCDLFQSK